MAKRFQTPSIPKGEAAKYVDNPYSNISYYASAGSFKRGDKNQDGILVTPDDDFLVSRGGAEAFNIYQKLLFDDTVASAMQKLTQEITIREWKLEAFSEKPGDVAVKEFVEEQLKDLQVDELYRSFCESFIVGYTVCEVMWRRTKGGIKAYDIRFRDQRRFRFETLEEADLGFTMKMVNHLDAFKGTELPPRKFICHRHWVQANGDPYGCGIGRVLYPLVKFKRRALESQLLYSDRFANPTAVANAPLSATTAEIETLYDHLSNLSQETALVMPEGYALQFVNPGGSPDTFSDLRSTLTADITLLIAGEDEAGSQGAGSKASSEVAQGVRVARAQDISELISRKLNNTLIRWIVDLNFGTNVKAPSIFRDFEIKDDTSLTMSDVATLVKDVGLKPTVEWISDRFNVELEEEQFSIPEGSSDTSGVNVEPEAEESEMYDGLDATANDIIEENDGTPMDSLADDLVGDEPEEVEEVEEDDNDGDDRRLKGALKRLLG